MASRWRRSKQDLKSNLYKVWNRMSSGSYIPPPVQLVEIPKDDGGNGRWAFQPWPIAWPKPW